MKQTFTQHVPAMVDLGDSSPIQFEFSSLEELLSHEYVKRFSKEDHSWQCSYKKYPGGRDTLMTVKNDGSFWWVVGYITDGAALNLPAWK
jgi:hypothetical protein